MFEHIEKRIVAGLVEEIQFLDAVNLELVGHNVISVIEGATMIHHGINKNYRAVGYTVDTFSHDSTIVGEYSAEQDYFVGQKRGKGNLQYTKINHDINHALSHKRPSGPDKIYLIASQEEPPSFRSSFNATRIGRAHGGKITILGARELAKTIYGQSRDNPAHASFYKQYFPGFSQDFDNFEYYGKVPAQCEGHISDSGITDAILHHYERGQKICVLYGLSGSGKTEAAVDFIHCKAKAFQNYIWISGDDWKSNTSLSAIQRTRGGVPVNVTGLFNSTKTILVIDGVERTFADPDFAELEVGFAKGGVVLATSQITDPGSALYLAMPTLSKKSAIQILGEDPDSVSQIRDEFVEACTFSPLILSTTRNIIKLERVEPNEFYKEVLNDPKVIAGPDGISILRRILEKLEPSSFKALAKIANSGLAIHDLKFLRHFVGINVCTNLRRLAVLVPTSTPEILKIHDLICAAVLDTVSGRELATEIESYIEQYDGEMSPSVLRQIHLGYKQLCDEHARRGDRDPDWLTYALLQIDGEVKQRIHDGIRHIDLARPMSLASAMSIIDAKEAHSYTIADRDVKKQFYEECAALFKRLLEETAEGPIAIELRHHRGKALRRCGQYAEALACFDQLLELKPKQHATHGQIAHLGVLEKTLQPRGEGSMRFLIEDMVQDASSVPLRVSLAALARLRSYKNLTSQFTADSRLVKTLADVIALAALEGFGQFYEAFLSFTSVFGYRHNLCCVALAEALSGVLLIPPKLVRENQWVSACEALANTAVSAGRDGRSGLSSQLAAASIEFAEAIDAATELNSYDARAIAKAYLSARMPKKAIEAIAKVPLSRIDHWLLYRKAQAQLELQDREGALLSANEALALASKDPAANNRISSYHDLLSRCHEALGDNSAALSEARLARTKCKDDQYSETLAQRVLVLENVADAGAIA